MKSILKMSMVSTAGMTFFSYILSIIVKEKFLETELLNQLVFSDRKKQKKNHPVGFILHFAVGTFFASIYRWLWKKTPLQPEFTTSTAMGFINGLAGVSVWHLFFRLHSNPPIVKMKKYYLQLLFAHMVFGALNGLMYRKKYLVTRNG